MFHILLISPDNTLFDSFRAALPAFVELAQLPSVVEARPYLASVQSDEASIDLIVLHPQSGPSLAKDCSDLRGNKSVVTTPLLVLLNRPEDRQAALECGANDYLLLPLLPAEVSARLETQLGSPLHIFRNLTAVIGCLKNRIMSAAAWEQGLKSLSRLFKAQAAWVFLVDQINERTVLIGGYNLPPLLRQQEANLYQEIDALFQTLLQTEGSSLQEIIGPYQAWSGSSETDDLTHHGLVPLHSSGQLFGLLTLAYPHLPYLSAFEKQALKFFGQNLGVLLEAQRIQEEIHDYATQNAFMVLIARTISERLDLDSILALTLEQVVPLLNASGGDMWLLSADAGCLELTSSLAGPLAQRPHSRRLVGQGLIGWVAHHGKSLYTTAPLDDPRCDLQVDQFGDLAGYSLLAVPVSHRSKLIGVLAVYNSQNASFTNRDAVLLEGIASLTASAIVNAQLLQELRENADQRRSLYEMSQQIAAGLDLQGTLNRTLHWVGRLFDVEIGLLWLVDRDKENLRLAAGLGLDWPLEEAQITVPLGEGLVGWVAQSGDTVLSNEPAGHARVDQLMLDIFKGSVRNILTAPMTYHGQPIGALSLVNKHDGSFFDEADLTLLSTALEIIAVAVGNARLYTQTVALMEERESLHRQVLQAERLATLGRLTAALSHEINNPMQAIQGALTLSLEELDNSSELEVYIHLSLEESKRVVKLLNRMRQIYRPQTDVTEVININYILQETIALARKELKRQSIRLYADLAPDLPQLAVVTNQIHLVFLSLLLNLSDAIGATEGRELHLRSYSHKGLVRVEFSTHISAVPVTDWLDAFKANASENEMSLSFGLSLSQDIIVAHGGGIKLSKQDEQVICRVELPVPELVSDTPTPTPTPNP